MAVRARGLPGQRRIAQAAEAHLRGLYRAAQQRLYATVLADDAPPEGDVLLMGHPRMLTTPGPVLTPRGVQAGPYLGREGAQRYLAAALPGRPARLVAAVAAMYAAPEAATYKEVDGSPRCDRCGFRGGPLGCNFGICGVSPYYACKGACTAELTLCVMTAQAAFSRLDELIGWFPCLLAARAADPGSAFAAWPVEVAFEILARALEPCRLPEGAFEPDASPQRALPVWDW